MAVADPTSSNPELHVYVAVSPMLVPVDVTPPLAGATGVEQVGSGGGVVGPHSSVGGGVVEQIGGGGVVGQF